MHLYWFWYLVVSITLLSIELTISLPPTSKGNFINSGTPADVTLSFDCTAREYAYQYGQSMQSRHGSFIELFDALQLEACNVTRPKQETNIQWTPPAIKTNEINANECIFYVDTNTGNDNNDGSIELPFKTIPKGIITARNNRTYFNESCILYLRSGTFYIESSILLTSNDSYLTIQNYPNEKVIISGGVPLKYDANSWELVEYQETNWKIYNNSNNCWGRVSGNISNDLIESFGSYSTINDCLNKIKSIETGIFYSLCWYQNNGECYGIHDHSWQPYEEENVYSARFEGRNIWSVYISNAEEFNNKIDGLRINGHRGIRARYPDQITEIGMQYDSHSGWIPQEYNTSFIGPIYLSPPIDVIYSANNYNLNEVIWPMESVGFNLTNKTTQYTGIGSWGEYHIGVGGQCNNPGIEPNYGYWCSSDSPRGDGYQHRSPSGIYLNSQRILPNLPYSNITGAIFQVYRPQHWYLWSFEVNDDIYYNRTTNAVNFTSGGFQGGEGMSGGSDYYIENVFEELTFPNEYFYNTSTNILYFYYNTTTKTAPPNNISLIATNTQTVFNITGSMYQPVFNVTVAGLTFQDTSYSYLNTHRQSGGDSAIPTIAAIIIKGAQYITIDSSLFTRLDGNCILLEGYNRNISISNNDFEWIGESVIISWGYTTSPDNNQLILNGGPDGRNGEQPRFTHIYNNLVHEIGVFSKQAAMYKSAVSCQSIIENNIFFNGPKTSINFHDQFGGANVVKYNLILNSNREISGGCISQWNRIPFITNINEESSITPAFNQIYQNFLFGLYMADSFDSDDGTARYKFYLNFNVYGGTALGCDFNGNYNEHYENIYAYSGRCYSNTPCAYDKFINNTAILPNTRSSLYPSTCVNTPGFVAYGNSLYNADGILNVCNTTLQNWVNMGNDPGTTINTLPTDQEIIQMAKNILKY